MAFLTSSQLFTFIMESTPGQYNPAVSATDVNIRFRDVTFNTTVERDDENSKYQTGTWFGSDESIIGKKLSTASAKIKMAPGEYTPAAITSGAPVHKLNYGDLLRNCGLKEIGVGTSATDDSAGIYIYYPDQSEAQSTASYSQIVFDAESATYQVSPMAGAMSNYTLAAEGVAQPWTLTMDIQGKAENVFNATSGVAKLAEQDIMRTVSDALRNTTVRLTNLLTTSATEVCVTSISCESGNVINQIECSNTESGINSYIITEINPVFTIDPLLKTLADFDWWSSVSTETFYKVEIDSEFIHIYIPRAQINSNSIADANGFLRNTINLRCLINIDNDLPAWLPISAAPVNRSSIPYYLGIEETLARY